MQEPTRKQEQLEGLVRSILEPSVQHEAARQALARAQAQALQV